MIADLKANHHFWSWILLIIFRYGQFIDSLRIPKWVNFILSVPYYLGNIFIIEGLLHCHFPRSIRIEPGISLFHPYGIMINRNTVIGRGVIIRNSVTLGVKHQGDPTYIEIGHGVDIGVGARIIGNVSIGKNCKIGTNAVVLNSFEDGSTIVGVPARKIEHKNSNIERETQDANYSK